MIRTRTPGRPGHATPAAASDLLARFGRLLDEEHAALLAGDEPGLTRLTGEKAALIEPLASLPAPTQADARAQLAAVVRRQRRNGRLLAERLADVQRRLDFFTACALVAPSAGASAGTYGRSGIDYLAPPARLSTRI